MISPSLNDEIKERRSKGLLHAVYERSFKESDLDLYADAVPEPELKEYNAEEYKAMDSYIAATKFEMVLVAIDDPVESKKIYYQAKSRNLNVNIADVPPLCDFYFGAIFRKGDLQIMVSTNGQGPRMARLIKDKIEEMFDYEIDKTIRNIGNVRKSLRKKCPGGDNESIKLRMEWMTKVTDSYSFKEWIKINNPDEIVEFFPEFPPKFEKLSLK